LFTRGCTGALYHNRRTATPASVTPSTAAALSFSSCSWSACVHPSTDTQCHDDRPVDERFDALDFAPTTAPAEGNDGQPSAGASEKDSNTYDRGRLCGSFFQGQPDEDTVAMGHGIFLTQPPRISVRRLLAE